MRATLHRVQVPPSSVQSVAAAGQLPNTGLGNVDDPDWRDQCYGSYIDFKGWHNQGNTSFSREDLEIDIRRADIRPGAKILEIGFGNGHFLDWARDGGYDVHGTEIIPELVVRAKERGHNVHQGRIEDLDLVGNFDLVVAFDVLEHLRIPEIIRTLQMLHGMLAPSGKVLARFPNAGSPFGAHYVHGDATHVSFLSPSSLFQLGRIAGFSPHSSHNAPRNVRSGSRSRLARMAAHLVRDIVQWLICAIYYRGRQMPMDPVVTVILEVR